MTDTTAPFQIHQLLDLAESLGVEIKSISLHPAHTQPWGLILESGGLIQTTNFAHLDDAIRNHKVDRTEALAREILATEAKLMRLKAERDGHKPASSGN